MDCSLSFLHYVSKCYNCLHVERKKYILNIYQFITVYLLVTGPLFFWLRHLASEKHPQKSAAADQVTGAGGGAACKVTPVHLLWNKHCANRKISGTQRRDLNSYSDYGSWNGRILAHANPIGLNKSDSKWENMEVHFLNPCTAGEE